MDKFQKGDLVICVDPTEQGYPTTEFKYGEVYLVENGRRLGSRLITVQGVDLYAHRFKMYRQHPDNVSKPTYYSAKELGVGDKFRFFTGGSVFRICGIRDTFTGPLQLGYFKVTDNGAPESNKRNVFINENMKQLLRV